MYEKDDDIGLDSDLELLNLMNNLKPREVRFLIRKFLLWCCGNEQYLPSHHITNKSAHVSVANAFSEELRYLRNKIKPDGDRQYYVVLITKCGAKHPIFSTNVIQHTYTLPLINERTSDLTSAMADVDTKSQPIYKGRVFTHKGEFIKTDNGATLICYRED
jgi:hypothetical protein